MKIKIEIILPLIILIHVVSLKGMLAPRYKKIYDLNKKLLSQATVQKPIKKAVTSYSSEQKKFFGTTTPPQNVKPMGQGGIIDLVKSWFWKPATANEQALFYELRAKGLEGILHELLYPEHTQQIADRAGLVRDIRIFNEEDRKKAEEKLSSIIKLDENYKTFIMQKLNPDDKSYWINKNLRTEESLFKTILFNFYLKNAVHIFKGTLLDEVLYRIFSGERSSSFVTTIDNELNYITLAQKLINKGMQINPDNETNYIIGYAAGLMENYKQLYEPQSFYHKSLSFMDEDSFKQLFKKLDPILEQLISDQKLKQDLRKMQKERQEIETNPQKYRDQLQEEKYRKEYIFKKGQILQWEHIRRTGDWSKPTSSFNSQVKFDESEYQEWKKTGYLRGEREQEQRRQQYHGFSDEFHQFFEEENTEGDSTKVKELKTRFNLPPNASPEITMQHIRAYQLENHPDRLKSRTDISQAEKNKIAKEFGEFMGRYDDVIKILHEKEKQEKQNRE